VALITTKKVLKYALLPGITPRVRNLFGTGFGSLCFLMAQIFGMTGLLPRHHPYLNHANIGRYGMRHVIAEAANNLELSRKNIDKILIFAAILAGAVILVVQFFLVIIMLLGQSAWAITIPAGNFFDTVNADTDVAFNLLVQTFGIPNFFCSASAPGTCAPYPAAPWPIHLGLQALFRFYSFGILLIGVLIFLYFVVVVITETAVTGHPFGQRFQNVWVPIRLVMALGLLVPLNFGLNSGQYITLYVAKLGSSLATNGWLRYNNAIAEHTLFATGGGAGHNPMGERESLIGLPQAQSITEVVEFMSLVHTCAYSYWATRGASMTTIPPAQNSMSPNANIRPYFIKNNDVLPGVGTPATATEVYATTDLDDALEFYDYGNITIRFGEEITDYGESGNVKPLCGDIVIPVTSSNQADIAAGGGAPAIMDAYFTLVKNLWFAPANEAARRLRSGGIYFYENTAKIADRDDRVCEAAFAQCGSEGLPSCGPVPGEENIDHCFTGFPSKLWGQDIVSNVQSNIIDPAIILAWQNYSTTAAGLEIEDTILERGWAGAGMWFNRIAYMNGSFSDAVSAVPFVKKYPEIMERVKKYRQTNNAEVTGPNAFDLTLSNGTNISLPAVEQDVTRAKALNLNYKLWNQDGQVGGSQQNELIQNIFMDTMGVILGADGLFDLRGTNSHIHPLSQLVMLGKGMIERTIKNLGLAAAGSFAAGILGTSGGLGALAEAGAGILSSTAFLGLTAGIILFYIVPFLPFVYFFFTVGTWVKSIFEAMVGMPLWALAHLRLDGEGLPGDAAANGYYLLLEIFVRPILTVCGLVAAIIIFTAQVRILNFIWDIVVENAAGFTDTSQLTLDPTYVENQGQFKRSIIDQFFFTIIYTIIVYMLATAAFKLIDGIPDHMLRWTGAGVSAFGDQNPDALQDLSRYVAQAGMIQGQQISGAITKGAQGLGGILGGGPQAPPTRTPPEGN